MPPTRSRTRLALLTAGIVGAATLVFAAPVASNAAKPTKPAAPHGNAATTMHGDFNGDGFADAAVGVDLKDVNGQADAGAVSVIYGSAAGLAAGGNQLFTQDSPGMLDQAETDDEFGRYMGGGDFDGDGFFDLAIGVPLEDVDGPGGPIVDAGAVQIMYGSPSGLTAVGNQFFTQLDLSPDDTAEEGDWMGSRQQGGDFNGDGFDDVSVSAMFEDVGSIKNAGAVDVIYGSPTGLTTAGTQYWNLNSPGVLENSGASDLYGRAAGTGDFNGDGRDDLAIGIAHKKVDDLAQAGAFSVLYGSAAGLTADGNQYWTENSPGLPAQAEAKAWLGRTGVAGGDFDADGFDDVAVGALQHSVDGVPKAGEVDVLYGSAAGLTAEGSQLFTENTPGSVSDGAQFGDRFGRTVESADANCDGYNDLSIGISHEGIEEASAPGAGAMVMLYGSPGVGLTENGNQFWHQDSPGILDQAEAGDNFDGRVPDFGDMNGDGCADIAVGVFKEDLEGQTFVADAGAMNVIYGTSGVGLSSDGNQFWSLASPGIKGNPEERDAFGQSNVG